MDLVEKLEAALVTEKGKCLDLESRLETQVTEDFNQMMVKMERDYETRLQQAQEKEQEFSEWRLNKVQEAMAERNPAKRKRARMDNDEHEMESEAKNLKLSDLQTQLDDKCRDVSQLESKVAAMKDVHQSVQEELRSVREQLSTTEFERETERINREEVEITLANVQKELEATNKSLAEQSNDPKIQELTSQLNEMRKSL